MIEHEAYECLKKTNALQYVVTLLCYCYVGDRHPEERHWVCEAICAYASKQVESDTTEFEQNLNQTQLSRRKVLKDTTKHRFAECTERIPN